MTRLRTVLVLGVVVVAAVGGAATAWVVYTEAPRALQNVLAVQGGTLLALAITVFALLAPTVSRLDELVEALRSFARGERHTRVHPSDFAGLADVARAVNDVGASLCENDDPNLGPVQRKVRASPPRPPSEEPRPSLNQPERPSPASSRPITPVRRPALIDGDVVGEVRKHQRVKEQAAPPPPQPSSSSSVRVAEVVAPARVAGSEVSSAVTSSVPTTPPTEPPRPIVDPEGVSDARVSRKNRKKAKRAAALAAKSSIPQPAIDADEPDEGTDTGAGTGSTSGEADEAAPTPSADKASSSSLADTVSSPAATVSSPAATVSAATVSSPAATVSAPADKVSSPAADKASAIMASTHPPVSAEGPATVIEPAPAGMPSRDELQRLFDEFRREKRAAGQGDSMDVDFDAFAETIVAESERLVLEHRCRGVRFEVAVADGEVSLRPRLLR